MNRFVVLVTLLVVAAPVLGATSVGATSVGAQDDVVTVTVHVTDVDNEDVRGVTVTVSHGDEEQTDTTRSNGQALFDVPRGATITVETEADGLVRNSPKRVRDVDESQTVSVQMYPTGNATITATDGGAPVEDATVRFRKYGQSVIAAQGTTDGDGVFSAADIEQGDYEVTVERPGYYGVETDLTVGDDAGADVALESGEVDVDFTVVDEHFEEPQPQRAEITIRDGGDRVAAITTNDRGQRGLDLAVNTEYEVVVEADGYETLETDLTVGEEAVAVTYDIRRTGALVVEPLNDRVVVGQSVRLEVVDEYGEPVAGADVLVDGSAAATTDDDGAASVAIERTGDVEITAEADGVTSDVVTVEGVSPDGESTETATDESDGTATEDGSGATATEESPEDTDTDTEEPDESGVDGGEGSDGTPGFTALLAVVALAMVALRRR